MAGRTYIIAGKRWRLVYSPLARNQDGECDPPDVPDKTIRVARRLLRYPRALAETLIHETIHAGAWFLEEDTVAQIASDITKVLEREGCLRDFSTDP
jgi:hypothetical protein